MKTSYRDLARRMVEQGGGTWLFEWYDKHGLKALSASTYRATEYEWYVDDVRVVVTFGYTPDEIAACPKYDLSGLPVDWAHAVEYRIESCGMFNVLEREMIK